MSINNTVVKSEKSFGSIWISSIYKVTIVSHWLMLFNLPNHEIDRSANKCSKTTLFNFRPYLEDIENTKLF